MSISAPEYQPSLVTTIRELAIARRRISELEDSLMCIAKKTHMDSVDALAMRALARATLRRSLLWTRN